MGIGDWGLGIEQTLEVAPRFREDRQLLELTSDGAYLVFMRRRKCEEGEVVFRKGDEADCVYVVASGSFRLIETGIELGAGQMVGEMGLVSEDHARTQGLQCCFRI